MSAPKPNEPKVSDLDQMIAEGRKEEESKQLTNHQRKVIKLMFGIEGMIAGFPDTPLKVRRLALAYAKFASTEPYKSPIAGSKWNGVVPAEWLMAQITDSCEFMPAPIVAR